MSSSDGDPARVTGSPERAPRRWGLRNWRVRSRLIALIAVPTVVAVVLGAVGVGGALSGAAAYGRVGTLADVAGSVTATVGDVASEQAESAAFVGAGRPADRARAVTGAQRRTDAGTGRLRALAAGVDDRYPESTRDRLRRVLFRLDTLPALRSAVTTGRFPAGVTVDRYDTVVTDLLALDDEIAQEGTDPDLSASVRALDALSRSRAALSTQRALLEAALLAGRFEPGGDGSFVRAIAAQDSALEQFRTTAPVAQTQRYDDVVAGPDVDQTSAVRDGVTAGRPPAGGAAAAGGWEASVSGTLAKVGDVESGLVSSISDRAAQLRSEALRQALVIGIIALAVILVVLLATTAVARSLVRPLRALRDGALSVAERRLPDTVARLGREDPDTVDTRVRPIAVHTDDEIGEVARSFDAVHQEAVRAAAGEARRRAQAGALFVTLSRRTQSLVDRQIELIDDLERSEEDADRLESLFRLDHLATRMRRNGENLLVLGGQEPVRRWNRRLPLLEVLRAALSEIEQYPRIDLGEVPDLTLAESAVSDVVHLLAELLDNATAFSSRASRVDVTATALPDGSALVEITDRGIGLTAQECEELDKRLAAPADVDVDASRRMGLYVVGRLAARTGARVWLSPGTPRGVTASVALPAAVLTVSTTGATETGGPALRSGSEGAWIGERFSRAIATPGPGADSWFGAAPLAATEPAPDAPAAAAAPGAAAFVPTASGVTDAGLPRREPGANEVPGTRAADGPGEDRVPSPFPRTDAAQSGRHAIRDSDPAPGTGPEGDPGDGSGDVDRSPEAIRERYAGYQRGRQQGLAGAEPTELLPTTPTAAGADPTERLSTTPPPPGPEPTELLPTTPTPPAAEPTERLPTTPPPAGPEPTERLPTTPTPAGPEPTERLPTTPTPAEPDPTERLPTTSRAAGAAAPENGATAAGAGVAAAGAGVGAAAGPEASTSGRAGAGSGVPAPGVAWGAGPVRLPTAAGSTSAGLPLRAPGANYVPGELPDQADAATGTGGPTGDGATDEAADGRAGRSADGEAGAEPRAERPAWDRSAEAIRQRFAAHQDGRRRGMERTGR